MILSIGPQAASPVRLPYAPLSSTQRGFPGVKLTYRVVDGARQGDWLALPMNQAATAIYEATVGSEELEASLDPPSYGAPATLEYYIQAFDSIGNRSESPTGTVAVEYCLY